MKTLGILGGMGPEATHFFYKKIVQKTPAVCDQEHIPTFIYSNSQIPDRGPCILQENFDSIVPELQRSAKIIEKAGADVIMMPCNTVHYFIDSIRKSVNIPVWNMIEETAQWISEKTSLKFIGILGTTSTVKSGMYHKALDQYGIQTLTPMAAHQEVVMTAIQSVKAGDSSVAITNTLTPVIQTLSDEGARAYILGCTEIPLLFENYHSYILIDPMDVLADKAIQFALSS